MGEPFLSMHSMQKLKKGNRTINQQNCLINLFLHGECCSWKHLTLMNSSLQNVNIHRTPKDALQTVPPHLWPTAKTHGDCTLLLLGFVTFPICTTCSVWWLPGWCAPSSTSSATHTHPFHTSCVTSWEVWKRSVWAHCVWVSAFISESHTDYVCTYF